MVFPLLWLSSNSILIGFSGCGVGFKFKSLLIETHLSDYWKFEVDFLCLYTVNKQTMLRVMLNFQEIVVVVTFYLFYWIISYWLYFAKFYIVYRLGKDHTHIFHWKVYNYGMGYIILAMRIYNIFEGLELLNVAEFILLMVFYSSLYILLFELCQSY